MKKVHRMIKFSQKAKKKAINNFDRDFFKLINNEIFGETMKNVRKHKNIKLVKRRINCLVSEPIYHITKLFTENLLATEMRKTQIMNKLFYSRSSLLDLGKNVMSDFWYYYVKTKYGENAKLCYINTDSFTVDVKTDNI